MIFRPLETFEEPRLKSTYMKGLLYTVRPGNELLASFVEDWLKDGRVELVTEILGKRVSGSGKVT